MIAAEGIHSMAAAAGKLHLRIVVGQIHLEQVGILHGLDSQRLDNPMHTLLRLVGVAGLDILLRAAAVVAGLDILGPRSHFGLDIVVAGQPLVVDYRDFLVRLVALVQYCRLVRGMEAVSR